MLTDQPHPAGGPAVVFDLDGTVCLGDGPALAYAHEAFSRLPRTARWRASSAFETWMGGGPFVVDGATAADPDDAYAAIARLAEPILGTGPLGEAYMASRARLEREHLGTRAPDSLPATLTALGDAGVERVLVTNSPPVGLTRLLAHLGVRDLLDQVITGADKPARFPALLGALAGPQHPSRLLSIGDHWTNDVAPALSIGAHGVLLSGTWGVRRTPVPMPATAQRNLLVFDTFDAAAPSVLAFAADPDGFAPVHGDARTTPSPETAR